MKLTFKSALVAGLLAVAALGTTAGTAQANTYQRNVQVIDLQTGNCLDSGGNGIVHTQGCNGGAYQRWNVLSYAGDVNNYYSRVQIQSVQNGQCLRVYHASGIAATVSSCDAGTLEDQWNMTWVGNTAGNPSNSFEFFNQGRSGSSPITATCLDAGQSRLLFQYDPQAGNTTCPNHGNRWQIWSMVP